MISEPRRHPLSLFDVKDKVAIITGASGAFGRGCAISLGALGVGSLALAGRSVQAQAAKPAELKVGIATYLSGPASVFGVPGRQAAEMLFDEINAEGGIAGVKVRPIWAHGWPGEPPAPSPAGS